ncbi:MAG: hypothetical protein PV340_01400 [Wolbachia sp.]|nr:hypothetical protein [Wolbachia sp.]MDD9335813.1 hypothetical protein [Wolbachia sp.]
MVIAKFLIEHTLVQNLNKNKPDFLNEELLNHWNECKDELEKIQGQKIGNSRVSFYDTLIVKENESVSYMENKDVIEILNMGNYQL